MRVKGFDHIVITTGNLKACLHFYVDILGMELDERNNRCELRFGNQKINIHRKAAEFLPAARNVTYGSQDICLIIEGSIEEAMEELRRKRVEIELGIVDRTGACGPISSIYLSEPDGNLVEISTYK